MEIMNKFLLLFFLLCGGCTHEYVVSIEDKYIKYVRRFVADGERFGRKIYIYDLIVRSVPEINEETIGQCERKYNTTPEVTISASFWENFSDAEKEELIYHELGHCVLKRRHNEYTDDWGTPVSMMNPFFLPELVYIKYHEMYIRELFHGK